MANNIYLIGDLETRECLVVDPAYRIGEILTLAAKDEMKIVGALVSHYHADHIGGSMMGHTIEGSPGHGRRHSRRRQLADGWRDVAAQRARVDLRSPR